MSRLMSIVLIALLVLLVLPMTACGPSSPEGKTAQIRAGYKIEINSWRAMEKDPPPVEEGAEETEASAEETGDATGDEAGEEAGEEMATGPQTTDIFFDLIIYFRGKKSLEGLTVDITHASASEEAKGTYQVYVETPGIVNGETQQADFLLEDVPFEEGDRFALTLVEGVPEDLGNYREFSEPAP